MLKLRFFCPRWHILFIFMPQLGTLLRFTGKSTHVRMILSKLYVAKTQLSRECLFSGASCVF